MNKRKKIYSWMIRCSVVIGVILLINVWLLFSSHCLTFASAPKNDEMAVANAENDKTDESAHILSQQPTSRLKTDTADTQSDFKNLIGRWIRKDGGYMIEIRSIDAQGKMDSGYYNPRPINVSVAEASKVNNIVKVFIELRDVGYPRSTYSLAYIPSENMLIGVYYQAKLGQTFEVIFIKME